MLLGKGQQRLGDLFGDERKVHGLSREGPLAGAAQGQQGLSEVDSSGVHGVQALDEYGGVAMVLARDIEQGLRYRQRSAQLVGGVGREALLLGDLRFEPAEHRVEAVRQLPDLVLPTTHRDPVRERPGRRHPGRLGDAIERGEHPAGQKPPPDEADDEQHGHHRDGGGSEVAQQVGVTAGEEDHAGMGSAGE